MGGGAGQGVEGGNDIKDSLFYYRKGVWIILWRCVKAWPHRRINYFSYYKQYNLFTFVISAALIFKIMEFRLGRNSCLEV